MPQQPPTELLRRAAERRLALAEQRIEPAVLQTMQEWLAATRTLILAEAAQQMRVPSPAEVTAAGFGQPSRAVDEATAAYNDWRRGIDNNVLPAVSIAFGEAFQQIRRQTPGGSYRPQQEYLATVSDRLRIWPEGAFEELRPELMEALAEAESIDDIRDRVGRVLGIDAETRDLKARINEVDAELAEPGLDATRRRELRALRRQLWNEHDASLPRWQWKARRIARTEAHGAVNAGQLAAAIQAEAESGETWHKRWLATEDTRTRATHRVADGQTVPLRGKFRVGGFLLDFPGDPIVIAPHETINCRCSMTILDPDALQDALQGPDGSLGEIRPGGVRVGTDDPDEAAEAVRHVADDEGLQLPPDSDVRGEDRGQAPPPPTPEVELTDEREQPVRNPDVISKQLLREYDDDQLLQLMTEAAERDDTSGLYEQVRNEYERRDRARRLDDLDVDTGGDDLDEREVQFVETFVGQLDQRIEWIPKDRSPGGALPTPDFRWINAGNVEVELKSIDRVKYASARNQIVKAIKRALLHGVTKDHFLLDFGERPVPDKVLDQLSRYNQRNPAHPVRRLWVLAGGVLREIVQR